MKSIAIVLCAVVFLSGCKTVPEPGYPLKMLTNAHRPVLVIATSRQTSSLVSVTFRDARGKIFVIQEEALASLRIGDIIY